MTETTLTGRLFYYIIRLIEDRTLRFYTFAAQVGNYIHVRGWDDSQGGHFNEKVPFKPTLFVLSPKETKFKTLDGRYVAPVNPGKIKECKEFIEDYKDIEGTQVFGMERFLFQYLSKEFDGEIEYDSEKVKLWSLDIETASENGFPKPELAEEEVLLITLKNFHTKKIITFGSRPYTPTRDDVNYVYCADEYALLSNFVDWWDDVKPEVITGWNVDLFDTTYLCNRIKKVCGYKNLKRLSPWGIVDSRMTENRGRKEEKYQICGVSILDYLDIYKKFTYTNRESYRLDHIAEVELGQKKLDHSEFDTFKDFYTNGWTKFVDYNLVDVDLVDMLEEKMKLIDLIMLMAYDAHVNYNDTFAQVRLWDIIIYNYLRKKNIVLDLINPGTKDEQFAGAYVKEPTPGSYDWVVSLDLNSLYPSLIRLLNISPETLQNRREKFDLEKIINKQEDMSGLENVCIAANGSLYSRDKSGFMPELVRKIYDERVQYKKTMLQAKQDLEDIENEMKRRGMV